MLTAFALDFLLTWYNERRGKASGSEGDICFSCAINEQASDEIGQKARQRGLASLEEGKLIYGG